MTPHLPATSARKVIKALERADFVVHHTTGGHTIMRHIVDLHRRVTIPMHNHDIKPCTMRLIIKQSGMSTKQFLDLL